MYNVKREEGLRIDQLAGVYERMAREYRTLFFYGRVFGLPERTDQWNASFTADQMLLMSLDKPESPIKMFIDSPGGGVYDGFRIIDTIETIPSDVYTIGTVCYSMGAVLLAAGTRGKRYVFENSHIMLHLPQGEISGDAKQMDLYNTEIKKTMNLLADALKKYGAHPTKKQILADVDREFYLTGPEAVKYGIADHVIQPKELVSVLKEGIS